MDILSPEVIGFIEELKIWHKARAEAADKGSSVSSMAEDAWSALTHRECILHLNDVLKGKI
jgi:hypothetical protein